MDGTMMLDWATHYKPVSNGNRSDGLAQDFVNENIELVRKLSFSIQLSDPDDYEGGNVQLMNQVTTTLPTKERMYCIV